MFSLQQLNIQLSHIRSNSPSSIQHLVAPQRRPLTTISTTVIWISPKPLSICFYKILNILNSVQIHNLCGCPGLHWHIVVVHDVLKSWNSLLAMLLVHQPSLDLEVALRHCHSLAAGFHTRSFIDILLIGSSQYLFVTIWRPTVRYLEVDLRHNIAFVLTLLLASVSDLHCIFLQR